MMIAPEEENPSKRLKVESIFKPFVPTGPFAASRSSALEDAVYLNKMRLEDVETDTLFFPNAYRGDPDALIIGRAVRNALKRPQDNEEKLRNAVYSELKFDHGIQFPASSNENPHPAHLDPPSGTGDLYPQEMRVQNWLFDKFRTAARHFGFQGYDRYRETVLEHLLQEFYRHREGDEDSKDGVFLTRLLDGLNVTTTSKPDMTVLRGKYLYFGEFKNSEKYTCENAAKQCTLYLYSLLYFFRARLGLDVKAVFGFYVCGPGCFPGDDEYSIGYIRLAAPENLGGSPIAQAFTKFYTTDSVAGIQQLICFLKFGKIVELGDAAQHVGRCIPAFLSLPRNLWDSKLLVLNGSASMVFKGTGDEILDLLQKIHDWPLSYHDIFLPRARNLLKGDNSIYYLKIRLKDTTFRESPSSTAGLILRKYKDLFDQIYDPIEMFPVIPVGDGDCGIFLMNNCGVDLHHSEQFKNLSFSDFCDCFATLWKDMSKVKHVFLHGDALPHNMVYNEQMRKIMMIDLDEGTAAVNDQGTIGKNAHKRVLDESDHHKYEYVRYPNYLRAWRNRQLYTDLQLAASFLLLVEIFDETLMEEEEKKSISNLRELADAANSFLKRENNKDPKGAYGSRAGQSVKQLVASIEGFLGVTNNTRT